YYYAYNKLSFLENDAKASSGMAASIIGNTTQWAVQVKLDRHLEPNVNNEWQVYALVRVETENNQTVRGDAFLAGIYDVKNLTSITRKTVPGERVYTENYHVFDLGEQTLHSEMYIWFAPGDNPEIKKMYIDRVILVDKL